MASHWSVPQIVAVSVVLAVAVLEGAAAVGALGTQSAPGGASASAPATSVSTPPTQAPSATESAAAGDPSAAGPSGTQEPTPQSSATAQRPRTSQPSTPGTTATVTPRQDLAADVAAAANAEREAAGIKPLTYTSCPVPATWAVHLATATTLTHNSLTTVLSTCGGKTTAGENIAVAYTTVADVTAGWMNSPNHQANILNPAFTTISVGVAQAADGTFYWVEDFTG
ncbi:MAG TPA: CAP domain-containing protein [Propionibacteriaceae bacterium]|nr:CAP domain-containing protein [Propionibacteriaceae bacterium]